MAEDNVVSMRPAPKKPAKPPRKMTPGYLIRLQLDGLDNHLVRLDREVQKLGTRQPATRRDLHRMQDIVANIRLRFRTLD
jgi:hypothetical protein